MTRLSAWLTPFALIAALVCVSLPAAASPNDAVKDAKTAQTKAPNKGPQSKTIDLVIALDTSGSMDGLIDSARQRIWDVVNDLATAKPTPKLRVGLISFGNDGYNNENGWTRVDVDLTSDLDTVYEKLMALRTNGGTEYVGRALYTARTQMRWTQDKGALKMIFVAGNESADQDPKFKAMNEAADTIAKDIIVNTIYCGNNGDSISRGWRDVANRADGQYANIDQNADAVARVTTPVDARLEALSRKLNDTYIPYGTRGEIAKGLQAKGDSSAGALSTGSAAARANAKASALYRNDSWDLVDAVKHNTVKLGGLDKGALPSNMRAMTPAQREAYIKRQAQERTRLQKEIRKLHAEREKHLEQARKKDEAERRRRGAPKRPASLNKAMRKTVIDQAEAAGFAF